MWWWARAVSPRACEPVATSVLDGFRELHAQMMSMRWLCDFAPLGFEHGVLCNGPWPWPCSLAGGVHAFEGH